MRRICEYFRRKEQYEAVICKVMKLGNLSFLNVTGLKFPCMSCVQASAYSTNSHTKKRSGVCYVLGRIQIKKGQATNKISLHGEAISVEGQFSTVLLDFHGRKDKMGL